MLYTRKGDAGTTKTFGCTQRISKGSLVAEALGTLDEINSYLGIVKEKSKALTQQVLGKDIHVIVHGIQQNLFIAQAELAGAEKTMPAEKITECESYIDEIERQMPPIKTFFISGGTELAAHFDFARTTARRAERRVVSVVDEGVTKVSAETLAYLNRLSSLLYALARYANHCAGIVEEAPKYK